MFHIVIVDDLITMHIVQVLMKRYYNVCAGSISFGRRICGGRVYPFYSGKREINAEGIL